MCHFIAEEIGRALVAPIDWVAFSAVLTAGSTIILTVITAFYARSTRQMLRESARQASAAEQSVEMLVAEHGRKIQQYRAPIAEVIEAGIEAVTRWMEIDFALIGSAGGPDSRELEVPEFSSLIAESRGVCFPLSQALVAVESHIVETRYEIDEVPVARGEELRAEQARVARAQLRRLYDAWLEAQRELRAWK